MEATGLRDGLLLALGGRSWLKRHLTSALKRLSLQVSSTQRFVTCGDLALLARPAPEPHTRDVARVGGGGPCLT